MSISLLKELVMLIIKICFIFEGMIVIEAFQMETLNEKFPLLWNEFKNYLKH